MKIQFRQVEIEDAEFLLEILTEREGHVNISHKSTPSWEEHVKFIESNRMSIGI